MKKKTFELILFVLILVGLLIASCVCLNYAFTLTSLVAQGGCMLLSLVFFVMAAVGSTAVTQELWQDYKNHREDKKLAGK